MDLATAQNIFAVRLYEWSQRDFYRELEEGCPLLSTLGLNERSMAAFVAWNETLSTPQRKALAIALTRRCHENARKLKGEVLTKSDEDWYRIRYEKITFYRENLVPALISADKYRPGFRALDPDECLDSLAGYLSPIMGKPTRKWSKVICTRRLGDWRIVTEFRFLRRDQFLNFEYQFIRKDGVPINNSHPAQGPFPRTLLLFYGLSDSKVTVPSAEDSDLMARVMAKLAEYFVAQADPLFAGLGIND